MQAHSQYFLWRGAIQRPDGPNNGGGGGADKLSEIAFRVFWKLAISQTFNHQKYFFFCQTEYFTL